jgi:hypothetical protein
MCGGAPFTALKWWSPNDWNGPKWVAESDREAIRIERSAETTFEPASITVASKFQSGWYQYVQHWKFDGYGEIHAELGMGGALHPVNADKAHVHHMYFRLDFDVDGSERQFFDVFSHGGFDDTSTGDRWQVQPTQGKHLLDPSSARKFRVRAARPRGGTDNMSPGYEIEVPAQAGMDSHSTGDIWAATYRRGIAGPLEEGETVGNAACNDLELDQFATGPLNSRTGSDVVLWVVVRHHHEPRSLAEENKGLPYHYEGFHLVPRGLTKFGYLNNVYPWQDGAESAPPEPKE